MKFVDQKTFEFYALPDSLKDALLKVIESGDGWGWNQNTYHYWEWYKESAVKKGYTCWGLSSEDYNAFKSFFQSAGISEDERLLMLFSW